MSAERHGGAEHLGHVMTVARCGTFFASIVARPVRAFCSKASSGIAPFAFAAGLVEATMICPASASPLTWEVMTNNNPVTTYSTSDPRGACVDLVNYGYGIGFVGPAPRTYKSMGYF